MADLTIPLTFRGDGIWGAGKGANLSAGEVDRNFYELAQALADLLASPPSPIEIASFNLVGTGMTIVMSNGTTVGPLPLPVLSWRWRDAWMPFVPYRQLDVFSIENTGIFLVLLDHTAAASFDPAATDGDGNPLYKELLGTAIPAAGGTTGQMLRKASNADNDTAWEDAPLPVAIFMPGIPPNSAIARVVMTEAGVFPADFAGSFGSSGVAATGTAVVTVRVSGVSIGTLTFTGSTDASLSSVDVWGFSPGAIVEFAFPSSPDPTLADIAITLRAIRS